jgi:hypothetical protein
VDEALNAVTNLLVSIVMLTVALAVVPLLLKLLVPAVGDVVWRWYWRLVRWLFLVPFRVVGLLVREAARR